MAAAEAIGFGVLLRQLRLAIGLTQEALAERAGVSVKAISGLERAPGRLPRLDTVAMLADALVLDPATRADFLAAARPTTLTPTVPAYALRALHALPRSLTPLIGRDEIATTIVDCIRRGETQLFTLTGPGGVGKTRLAIEVATRLADDFADGATFVDLTSLRDPNLVLPTIALRLGLDEREQGSLRERLFVMLRAKHILLLLDNLEHLITAWVDVLDLTKANPGLTILATSRIALRVRGEREYRITPLNVAVEDNAPASATQSAAVALFLERAQAVGVTLESTATVTEVVAQICRRLDGLPLGIELAAAWTRLLPLPTLLTRLEHRLPLLVAGPYDLPTRQRTMRDAIAWSYDLLTPSEQRLFRCLAIFAGGCTPESVESICTDEAAGAAVLDALATLVDKSLLQRQVGEVTPLNAPRLTFLETIREYGLEQLAENGEAERIHHRHAAYYLALGETAESALSRPNGRTWIARLQEEHGNLRVALAWLIEHGEGVLALRLSGALGRFWSEQGHLSEGRSWLSATLTMPVESTTTSTRARGKALTAAALLAIEQAAHDEAMDYCAQAVALARDGATHQGLIVALNAWGLVAQKRGEYPQAIQCHEEAYTLAEGLDDQGGMAAALTGLAYATAFAGDAALASTLSERSVAIFRQIGDLRGLADALVGAATHATFVADYARAERLSTEGLDCFRKLGDTGRMSEALWVLGVTAQFQGQQAHARSLFEECAALCRVRGDEHGTVQPLTALGRMALHDGDHQRARTMLQETLGILQRYDNPWGRAMSLALLAHVELATNKIEQAQLLLTESIRLHQTIGNPLFLPWCMEGLAGVAAARGDWGQSARLCGEGDALRDGRATPAPPAYPDGHTRILERTRAALGNEAFAAAYQSGREHPSIAKSEPGSS